MAYDKVSEASAEVLLKAQVRNDGRKDFTGMVEYELLRPDGRQAVSMTNKIQVHAGKAVVSHNKMFVENPLLWSPENPVLYNLNVRISDCEGNVVDGYCRRIGIRSVEFKGKEVF